MVSIEFFKFINLLKKFASLKLSNKHYLTSVTINKAFRVNEIIKQLCLKKSQYLQRVANFSPTCLVETVSHIQQHVIEIINKLIYNTLWGCQTWMLYVENVGNISNITCLDKLKNSDIDPIIANGQRANFAQMSTLIDFPAFFMFLISPNCKQIDLNYNFEWKFQINKSRTALT